MRPKPRSAPLTALILTLLLAGCAARPVLQDGITINDPFEAQNRRVHAFNKALDAQVIGPVARLVAGRDDGPTAPGEAGQPRPVDLVINMGANLSLPGKIVNSLLQGQPGPAARNMFRLAINSTLGIAGMFDPAGSDFGLTETDTDFGQTLAVWGLPEGAYVELPLLGPSTARDTAGKVVDVLIDPLGQVLDRRERMLALGLRIGSKAGERARFGDTVDSVLQDSADSYAQTRLIYLMHRRYDVGEEDAGFDPYDDPYGAPVAETGPVAP
ncbi:MlaA family lipoprotein [Paracoccus spongiarum]|uniref:VacJ family lipoprotein n=1 Tax=Paracoccus spongiarum TaxID=3064387 RepID=A0ABT9J7T8_9RHOB|nr:VacJ family lipoprotein [Paracoccus sp. 2205BS29-5]MDP5305875.1 VacJ family lipoprotein [Paracoccus sp. 2205BS29-5]